jgi:hypothetical protein
LGIPSTVKPFIFMALKFANLAILKFASIKFCVSYKI